MADVFISYARADREKINMLATALEHEGYSVWWDRHIKSGAEFASDIERELETARAVIACWSSEGSKSNWVKDEANFAAEAGKMLAVCLDDGLPPIGFRQYHAIDFSSWRGGDNEDPFRELIASIRARLADEAVSEPTISFTSSLSPTPQKSRWTRYGIWGAAFSASLLVLIGVFFLVPDNQRPTVARQTESGKIEAKSIAVLPFRDLSPGGDQQWFSNGLAEEIIATITRVPDIYVSPAADSFALRDEKSTLGEIAKSLNVANILSGSIRRDASQIRITVELIRTHDGSRVWSQTYDREPVDAISIQEDIAKAVARVLETAIDPEALAEMTRAGTASIEAYENYLRGLAVDFDDDNDDDWIQKTLDHFERATEIDPSFLAPRLEVISALYYRMTRNTLGWAGLDQALLDATAFNKQIDQTLALVTNRTDLQANQTAEQVLAFRDLYELRFSEAARRYEKLTEKYPKNADYWVALAMNARATGDYETARQALRRYVALTGLTNGWAYQMYYLLGISEEAKDKAIESVQSRRGNFEVYRAGMLLAYLGDANTAREALGVLNRRDSFFEAQQLLRVRIACTEGEYAVLNEMAVDNDRIVANFARSLLGETIPTSDEAISLERSEPPYVLVGWGYSPEFNTTDLPITRAVLDKAGLPHDQPSLISKKCAK